ncbi:preprotein translocase subunit YajC [Nocardioides mangrovi]|uniref:Preprotein translocase subunit YajC n=1 Tax=Nocardioides mangrovi TaxID=2874580 RepID=A0ABS7UKS8_9ACTN|nr:preprotein translocase subunit YajC [Nocardioides mangrovi]MBZ5741177.1 preprotein translocase subunit YajC [Nocardioides mangrovi]
MLELLPLVGIVLLFWLFIIRPASRRQKEMRTMQSSVSVGDEIVLTSGVYGTVRELDDEHVHLEIAPGVTIKVARGAIGTVNHAPEPSEPAGTDESDAVADGPEEN